VTYFVALSIFYPVKAPVFALIVWLGHGQGMASNTINSSPSFMEPIRSAVVIPGVLLLLILIFWYLLKKLWYERRYKTITAHTTIDLDMSIKYVLNIAIDVTRLHEMLKFKFIMQEEIVNDDLNSLRKVSLKRVLQIFDLKLMALFQVCADYLCGNGCAEVERISSQNSPSI